MSEQQATLPAPARQFGATLDQVESAMNYVPSLARRYRGAGIPFDELLAAGNLGLVEAALRFDPERGVKFVTYADWWIRKSILETLEEQLGPMRLPRYQHERLRALRAARRELTTKDGCEPDAEALAEHTGVPERDARKLLGHQSSAVSLEQGSPGDDRPLKDRLPDDEDNTPQSHMVREDLLRRALGHLAHLDVRERKVLRLRFGLGGQAKLTLREVGERLGISRERVRQVEMRALGKLRRRI